MDINVRYKPDPAHAARATWHVRQKHIYLGAALGLVEFICGLIFLGYHLPLWGALLIVLGIVFACQTPLLLKLQIRRNWATLGQEVELALNDRGLQRHTKTTTIRLNWDTVKQVEQLKDFWVFRAKGVVPVTISNQVLSQEQQAELTSFLSAKFSDRLRRRP